MKRHYAFVLNNINLSIKHRVLCRLVSAAVVLNLAAPKRTENGGEARSDDDRESSSEIKVNQFSISCGL